MFKKVKKKIKSLVKEENSKPQIKNNADFTKEEHVIVGEVTPYTSTGPDRIVSLINATKHIVEHNIEGVIIECGVWRGGSMMAVLRTLKNLGVEDREVYLYDTFEGMSEPTEEDKSIRGESALNAYAEKKEGWDKIIYYSSLDEVKENISSIGYAAENIHYVKGKVEDTISNDSIPDKIALLRLDTDWYESTKHELEFLFPRLVSGGILIIDDYGHWEGCKKAVDEYFSKNKINIFLARIDYTGRIGVKM
ncbi:TylF/MycF/NovP-related O-methyltransferase [Flavobacteriaceae bacterium S356]|uniref:TylF/MycF/NovP-related O-methyltransferase n=1 Tax=Asprobacillus argus TaxID=3076534 RepID=A0ABU3LEU7_9FLAO|nr:TylF/MycF/NovP-related O-methyltransferase [Flavobacteriaceae bacterium S356]